MEFTANKKWGAIVLSGGKSSRMGQDKATLPFGPELMLQRVVRILSQVVEVANTVVVAASAQVLPPLPFEVIVARDKRPYRGPLEGIAGGLRVVPQGVDAVYATSCDVPLTNPAFVSFMFERLRATDEIIVAVDGQYRHPLAAIYRPRVLAAVESLLAADHLSPQFLFELVSTQEISIEELRRVDPDLATLMNLNLPEDYQRALELAFPKKRD